MCDPILRPHQLQLVAAAGLGFQQHFMDRGAGEFEGVTQVVAEQQGERNSPEARSPTPTGCRGKASSGRCRCQA